MADVFEQLFSRNFISDPMEWVKLLIVLIASLAAIYLSYKALLKSNLRQMRTPRQTLFSSISFGALVILALGTFLFPMSLAWQLLMLSVALVASSISRVWIMLLFITLLGAAIISATYFGVI